VIRTFLDSGVLIAAFRSRNTVSTPALTLLDDPERVFVTTDYVRLEVLPKPLYFRRETEAAFYEAFCYGETSRTEPPSSESRG